MNTKAKQLILDFEPVRQDNEAPIKPRLTFVNAGTPTPHPRDEYKFFYISDQWIKLRYRTLVARGNRCECDGREWSIGNPLQVDHIKPISLYPHLALEQDNLQVLCRDCNKGKSNTDMTDWRRPP